MLVPIEDLNYELTAPNSENLIKIYEHFLELQDCERGSYDCIEELASMPSQEWYLELSKLIEEYGFENYRAHLIEVLDKVTKLQEGTMKIERRKKRDEKKSGRFINFTDYVIQDSDRYIPIFEAPSHYYFYSSDKGRYLKGLIQSVACIPDPQLLKMIERLAIIIPFKVGSVSQAPTGLYTYDILEVFSKLDFPKPILYIMSLKAKIKQTWAQKRFDKKLKEVAKIWGFNYEDVIEFGMPSYGFDEEHVYKMNFDDNTVFVQFDENLKKEVYWLNEKTGKKQKSVPKQVRIDYPERLKYFKTHLKDIESQLYAQIKRIEKQYLTDKSWNIDFWKKSYLDHPFIGIIAKQQVWLFLKEDSSMIGIYDGDFMVTIDDQQIKFEEYDKVKLWHPKHSSGKDLELVKKKIEKKVRSQPIKQALREFYQIDFIDKVRGSKMKKSILSQLCKSRNWTSSQNHKLSVPGSKLSAILKVKEVNDDSRGLFSGSANVELEGVDFKIGKKQISAQEINPITLSEILRDVDLFVNSAKLKNEND